MNSYFLTWQITSFHHVLGEYSLFCPTSCSKSKFFVGGSKSKESYCGLKLKLQQKTLAPFAVFGYISCLNLFPDAKKLMEYLPTFTLVHGHVSPNVGKSSIHFSHLGLHFPKHIQGLVPLQMLERFFFPDHPQGIKRTSGNPHVRRMAGNLGCHTVFFWGDSPQQKKKTRNLPFF